MDPKVKSLIYFVCFLIASITYYNLDSNSSDLETNKSVQLAQSAENQNSSIEIN
jgi:hypothetical protein